MAKSKYTTKQWLILVVFGIVDFCNAICVSLQAPFYPAEAEAKGATATEYGFVFGVFELTVFLVSPIYGRYLSRVGAKFMFNAGIFTTSTTCILFGFLDRIDDTRAFIGLSFAVRIVEAMGNAAFLTASFSLIAMEFPDNVGATFASLETCFGLGMIVGPTVGGALYEVGGYTLPFLVLGLVLMSAACMTYFVLPKHESDAKDPHGGGNLMAALKIPSISIAAFAIVAASISIGFLQATLEPHLRPLSLTPLQTGLMFVLNGGAYAILAPLWGYLCDKGFSPRAVTVGGSLFVCVAFLMIGPAPFFNAEPQLSVCIAALILHGIGFGAELVSTFAGAQRDAVANGFPDDISTYGLVSGLWTSTFALGAFIGPSVAGILLDLIGFDWASVFVVALHFLVALSTGIFLCYERRRRRESIYVPIHSKLALEKEETLLLSGRGGRDSCYASGCSDSSEEYVF
ncbi:MFS-type transporter SLC18B1-like [Oratosquilla oratoria]|uniref:MFS-type transporter SLC18B1-like n=1 Tax=Oratosquilla oratoria TaxID=337810 RepID=UPI003F75C811